MDPDLTPGDNALYEASSITVYWNANEYQEFSEQQTFKNFTDQEEAYDFINSLYKKLNKKLTVCRLEVTIDGEVTQLLPENTEYEQWGIEARYSSYQDEQSFVSQDADYMKLVGLGIYKDRDDTARELPVTEFKELIRTGSYPVIPPVEWQDQ